MLMDPPVMQADCQLQNDVEKMSSIAYDRKHTLSHDNYGWQGPDVHLTVDAHNPVEVNNSSRTGSAEKLDGSSEKPSASLDGLPQVNHFIPHKEKNGEDTYFNDVRFQLNISFENNGSPSEDINCNKHCIGNEDFHHSREEIHAPASRVAGLWACQSNGDAKQNVNVEAERKDVGSEILKKEVRTDITNDIGLVYKNSQEENETSISPESGMDLLVHNNSCNGNTNDAAGEMGAEYTEDDNPVALWVKVCLFVAT
jgi:hypothetical protein